MRRFSHLILIAFVAVGYASGSSARTSTTDYLVRLQALAYLEEQHALRASLNKRLKAADAQMTAITQPESDKWNSVIAEAERALAIVEEAEKRELEIMKETQARHKVNLAEQIEEKEEELQNLKKPKGLQGKAMKAGTDYFNYMVWGTTPEQQKILDLEAQKTLAKEIAILQVSLKDLEKDESTPPKVMLTPELLVLREESQDAIADALTALANLKTSARIMTMKHQIERLKAYLETIDRSGMCMAKLAKCASVKGWDSLDNAGSSNACKIKNLEKAKKATNAKCKALTTKSTWMEIDACIPEYRREILKKPGTEGSRKAFDACRRL